MRAVVVDRFMTPDSLGVNECAPPPMMEDGIRISVRAAGCNFSDILMLKGEYQAKPLPPFVPGGEVAGVVIEVGTAVRDFSVGDRVLSRWGRGGFAEEVCAPAATTYRSPDAMTFEAGSARPTV